MTAPARRRGADAAPAGPQPQEEQPAVTPDDLVKGTVIRIPAEGRRQPYCLDIVSRDLTSQVTEAVQVTGKVLGATGTTTRTRPLYRTAVVMPGRITIIRPRSPRAEAGPREPLSERERLAVSRHRCPRCGIPRLNRCRSEDGPLLDHPHQERTAKVPATADPASEG